MGKASPENAKFLRLYSGVQVRLYCFILAVVHNRDDADELLQETAVVMWDKFDQYNEEFSFGAWSIGIARNKIFEYLRKNKKAKKIFESQLYDQLSEFAERSSCTDFKDRLEALDVCVEKLKPQDKKLITLRYHNGTSVRKISQLSGRSVNSLYKSIARIVFQLRRCISHQLVGGGLNDA